MKGYHSRKKLGKEVKNATSLILQIVR
jgi:hypothetical protein